MWTCQAWACPGRRVSMGDHACRDHQVRGVRLPARSLGAPTTPGWAQSSGAAAQASGDAESTEALLTSTLARVFEMPSVFRVSPLVITYECKLEMTRLFFCSLRSKHARARCPDLTHSRVVALISHVPDVPFYKVNKLQPAYAAPKHTCPILSPFSKDSEKPGEFRRSI